MGVDLDAELLNLEQAGWQSLVDGNARTWFREVLSPDIVVVGAGSGVVSGDAALDHLSGSTWSWVRLRGPRVVSLSDSVALIAYRVIARRDFDVEYQAMVSSSYVRVGDDWKLAVHQQTPV
jgi:hypothetical protein